MKQFAVDDDVVDPVWQLARPQKFESFSEALRRLLTEIRTGEPSGLERKRTVEEILAELDALPDAEEAAEKFIQQKKRQRAPSPDPQVWVSEMPELRNVRGLNSWKAICGYLEIDALNKGDSARRKLREFVRENRPK